MRAAAAAIGLLVLCGTVACRPGFFGRRGVQRVDLQVARQGDDVLFTADDLFERITCGVYDPTHGRTGAPEHVPGNTPPGPRKIRIVWRARCPHGNDCARAVVYGDTRLNAELAAVPLTPSEPAQCYVCSVSGDRRRGDVRFAIAADGSIEECRADAAS